MSDAKAVEQFVLAQNGGVLSPVPVRKVCEMLLAWSQMVGAEESYVPNEWRCHRCNYRIASSQTTSPPCPIDGTPMVQVTWRESALTASRIASRARKRCEILEEAWPSDFPIPIGEEAEDKSIEEKIERLQERGLCRIEFEGPRVRLLFLIDRREIDVNSPKGLSPTVYPTLDEAVSAEYLKRQT